MSEKQAFDVMIRNVENMAANVATSRVAWLRKLLDPRRDIDSECGYPEFLTPWDYQRFYERFSIAARVVELMPKETWEVTPDVTEDPDAENDTAFEEAFRELPKQLRGQSWYQGTSGNPVWETLKRADILSRIGQFGIVFLGFSDNKDMSQPVGGQDTEDAVGGYAAMDLEDAKQRKHYELKPVKGLKLLYMRTFPEHLVQITQFESDPSNPRFGQPVTYLVTFNDPNTQHSGIGLPIAQRNVHWTRVIHLSENLTSSTTFALSSLQQVANDLLDLIKLYGGSAEMYWQGAFPGLSFESHPQLGGDVKIKRADLKAEYEQYVNGLQRALFVMGMSVKTLSPTVVDPTPQINVRLEAICIKLGCPMRVFKGSERGELASSQDDATWNDRKRERQNNYLTPCVIVPFVDRLIALGVLPEPEFYTVEWPDVTSMSAQEKAQTALTKTQALQTYVSSGAQAVITPIDFLTRWLDFPDDVAQAMLDSAASEVTDEEPEYDLESPLLGMVGGISGMLSMFTSFQQGAMSEETLKQLIMLFYKVDQQKADDIVADGLPKPPPGLPPVPAFGRKPAAMPAMSSGSGNGNPSNNGNSK